jgi:hypothetical protein
MHDTSASSRRARPSAAAAAAALSAVLLSAAIQAIPHAAEAQIAGAREATPQDAWNPRPDPGDFIVPLPCGLGMAFRPIFVPWKGFPEAIYNVPHPFPRDEDDPVRKYSRKHKAYMESPLSVEHLPAAYRKVAMSMRDSLSRTWARLYLVAKYETTVAQYDAVVREGCRFDPKTAALPVVGVTWHEARLFTELLTEWIMERSPGSLPSMEKVRRFAGVIRLPTEDEWEYAARGGHAVSGKEMASVDIFPMGQGEDATDYGLYYSPPDPPVSSPARVGGRKPNPAGLFDTVGNAAEMTLDTFRMLEGIRNRGPGPTLGFVLKGGSYLTRHRNLAPILHKNYPFRSGSGEMRSPEIGFRVTLSAARTVKRVKRVEGIDGGNGASPTEAARPRR